MTEPRRVLPTQSQLFFLAIVVVTFFLTWRVFQPFVIFMVTGVLVAVLALPIDRFWERLMPNRVAGFFSLFTIFLVLTIPLVGIGFALFSDAEVLVERVQSGQVEQDINSALDLVYPDQSPEERNETLDAIWGELQPRIESGLRFVLANAAGFIGKVAVAMTVILFVAYYVLTDGHHLVAYLRRAAPLPATQVDFLMREAHNGVKAVFFGQILTSLIQGALGGIGFLIAGVPGAVVWAAIMAVLSLLPVIGAFLVWIPAVIYLLVTGDIWQGAFLAAWGVLVVSQVDNFIRPKLIGDRADIHPLFVLVGVLGGVAAFGFIGLFLGPLLVGVTVSVLKVWEADYLLPDPSRPPKAADDSEE